MNSSLSTPRQTNSYLPFRSLLNTKEVTYNGITPKGKAII